MTVVIVTRDRPDDLAACISSLEHAKSDILEVIVVDDASETRPSANETTLPTRILRNETRSFLSESRNRGARAAKGKYVMFLDDDNVVDAGCIRKLCASLESNPRCAVASPAIFYASQPTRVWFAGGRIAPVSGMFLAMYRGSDSNALPLEPYRTQVFHDAFMVDQTAFGRVGYFDEVSFPMYLSEADFAARLWRSDLGAVLVPSARVWHNITPLEGASSLLRGIHMTEPARAYFVGRNRLLYMRKYATRLSFIVHVLIFEPVIISIHLFAIVMGRRRTPSRLLRAYFRGLRDGLAGRAPAGGVAFPHSSK